MQKHLLLALLLFNALVYAEDFFRLKDQILKDSKFHLLGIHFRPLIFINDAGYSTNIYSYDEKETPDWLVEPGIDVSMAAIIRNRLIMMAQVKPYYSFFARTETERSWNYTLKGDLHTYFGPFNLHAGVHREWERILPSSEFGIRVRRRSEGVQGDLDWGSRNRFFVSFYGHYQVLDYKEENYLGDFNLRKVMNHSQATFGFRLNKKIFSRSHLFLDFQYEQYRFDFSPERDLDSRRLGIGLDLPMAGSMLGSVSFGVKEIMPENPDYQSYIRPWGEGNVRMALGRRLLLKFDYMVDFFHSLFGTDLNYQIRSIGGGADWYFNRFLKISGGFSDRRLSYHSFQDEFFERMDRMRQISAGLHFRVFRTWSLGLVFVDSTVDSTILSFRRHFSFFGGSIRNEF